MALTLMLAAVERSTAANMVSRLLKRLILELYPMTTLLSYSKLDHGYGALKGKRLEDLCSSVSYLCTHLAISWNSV